MSKTKKVWQPDDWWCGVCKFKIFGTKDSCSKCGLRKSQWVCSSCGHIADTHCQKCPQCGGFNSLDAEYFWIRWNGTDKDLAQFVAEHPKYEECSPKCACAQIHCWKHS